MAVRRRALLGRLVVVSGRRRVAVVPGRRRVAVVSGRRRVAIVDQLLELSGSLRTSNCAKGQRYWL